MTYPNFPPALGPVLGIGELLWDLFPTGPIVGGAPFNFAFHACQAGLRGIPVSSVGNDEPGQALLAVLQSRGLDTSFIQIDPDHPTGSVGITLKNGLPHYTIHENTAWDHIAFTDACQGVANSVPALCFGTLAQRSTASRDSIQRLVKQVGQAGGLCILDVNLRQQFYSREILESSLSLSRWVKLSAEDWPGMARAMGLDAAQPEVELERMRTAFGLELVAYTDGDKGAILYTPQGIVRIIAPKVSVVDTVGAGDAFTAGLLAARPADQPWWVAASYAVALAAEVVKHPGGAPSLSPEVLRDIHW